VACGGVVLARVVGAVASVAAGGAVRAKATAGTGSGVGRGGPAGGTVAPSGRRSRPNRRTRVENRPSRLLYHRTCVTTTGGRLPLKSNILLVGIRVTSPGVIKGWLVSLYPWLPWSTRTAPRLRLTPALAASTVVVPVCSLNHLASLSVVLASAILTLHAPMMISLPSAPYSSSNCASACTARMKPIPALRTVVIQVGKL